MTARAELLEAVCGDCRGLVLRSEALEGRPTCGGCGRVVCGRCELGGRCAQCVTRRLLDEQIAAAELEDATDAGGCR